MTEVSNRCKIEQLFIVMFLSLIMISCANARMTETSHNNSFIEDTLKAENMDSDTFNISQEPFPAVEPERLDSLDGWEAIEPEISLYYKNVMLTLRIVDIINPQLKMYLADYIIPLVKRKGFDESENFIFVSHTGYGSGKESADIFILVSYCGMTYQLAHDIFDGRYRVAFIDEIPIMFEDFKKEGYIKDTNKIFEFRKWEKDFPWLSICDADTEFYFKNVDGNIHYLGYCAWELRLVKSESDMPEVWKPEQTMRHDKLSTDSISVVNDSSTIEQIYVVPNTIMDTIVIEK